MNATLFDMPASGAAVDAAKQRALNQYNTPVWAAQELWDAFFADVGAGSTVCEPACGPGAFLSAIPPEINAFGVDIDPDVVELARRSTGRRVILGDFNAVELPERIDAFVGNPPFASDWLDGFLDRAFSTLPLGGKAGLILPSYLFQTSARVTRYSERFTLRQEMLPGKALFPGISHPVSFVLFQKDLRPQLIGFRLFRECEDLKDVSEGSRQMLVTQVVPMGGLWKQVVADALRRLGGKAELSEVYEIVGKSRPTANRAWHEKIRQTVKRYPETFLRVERGCYALAA